MATINGFIAKVGNIRRFDPHEAAISLIGKNAEFRGPVKRTH